MNSLETEYSFLAPTWKLSSVTAPSMYPATFAASYLPSGSRLDSDTSTWNNNPRYLPPTTNHRPHPYTTNQHPGGQSMPTGPPSPQTYPYSKDSHRHNENNNSHLDYTSNNNLNNEYDLPTVPRHNDYSNQQIDHRGMLTYPSSSPPPPPHPPVQKRVQIIDHNRRTPSTDYLSGRDSPNSPYYNNHSNHSLETNQNQSKPRPRRYYVEDNKSDSSYLNNQRSHNFNIHEYLYGLSAPDPGSYVNAYKNHQRRLQDEKLNRKSVLAEYKTFVQNGGFGPAFGNYDHRAYEEKLDTEKKRKSYSKLVRQANQNKVEEQKRIQNNGGQQRNRAYAALMPRLRRPDEMRSHFLTAQEVRDFERRIKREHDANCKCSLHAKPKQSSN